MIYILLLFLGFLLPETSLASGAYQAPNFEFSSFQRFFDLIVLISGFACLVKGGLCLYRAAGNKLSADKESSGRGAFIYIVVASLCFSFYACFHLFTNSVFGDYTGIQQNLIDSALSDLNLSQYGSANTQTWVRNIYGLLMCMGYIGLLRGFLMLTNCSDYSKKGPLKAAITHIIASVILVNFYYFAQMIMALLRSFGLPV